MTTRVHIVNIGAWPIEVKKFNPAESANGETLPFSTLYPGDSVNEYVYDTQVLQVSEKGN